MLLINLYVAGFSNEKNYFTEVDKLPTVQTGLVLGSSVKRDGTPSIPLENRLKVAVDAYKQGKIKEIIVSGYSEKNGYNEPIGMQKYLMQAGIPKENIILDDEGNDTYDSIYRSYYTYHKNNIIVFTQGFHLKRVLYFGTKMGAKMYGMETKLYTKARLYNEFREFFARIKAFYEADILKRTAENTQKTRK
ncbi:YdcF family protein [Candidatus Gracilibacteria bacterium]|nr:YdcF family protein [Candidatus Gracilibacteria bacterium]